MYMLPTELFGVYFREAFITPFYMSKILVFIRQEKGFCCTKYQVCADEGSFTLDLLAMGGDPTMAFSAEGNHFTNQTLIEL